MPASLAALVFSTFFLGSLLVIGYFEERWIASRKKR